MEEYEFDLMKKQIKQLNNRFDLAEKRESRLVEQFGERMEVYVKRMTRDMIREVIQSPGMNERILDVMARSSKNNFEGMFTKIYEILSTRLNAKVHQVLKQAVNLKNSTIQEISCNIDKIGTTPEEDCLNQLKLEFPEYYKQIEHDMGAKQ